jgi:hypothetical protein
MARRNKETKNEAGLKSKTKSQLIEEVLSLRANDEQCRLKLLAAEDESHDRCCEFQEASEKHKNDPNLFKNMIKGWANTFEELGISIRIKEEDYITFVKGNIELRLPCFDLLRLGVDRIVNLFGNL